MSVRSAGARPSSTTTRSRPAAEAKSDPPRPSAVPAAEKPATFDAKPGQASALPAPSPKGRPAELLRAEAPASAGGEPKWKTAPPGAEVIENTTGRGAWVEKWRNDSGKWVHNYTLAYMEQRSDVKFVDNRRFGEVLTDVRARVAKDLGRDGTKAQLCALVVALIDQAYFRVGNEESDDNGVYGATTLLKKHLSVHDDGRVEFEYVGKASVEQHRVVVDKQIAKILKRLKAGAGPDDRLFVHKKKDVIDAGDVNRYLAKFNVTAKQFRTFHATRLVREALLEQAHLPKAERPAAVEATVEQVAALLGHTAAVCRGSYVDPTLIDDYVAGEDLS